MGIIRFKYGFESIIINSNQELENLKKIIDGITLNSGDHYLSYYYHYNSMSLFQIFLLNLVYLLLTLISHPFIFLSICNSIYNYITNEVR